VEWIRYSEFSHGHVDDLCQLLASLPISFSTTRDTDSNVHDRQLH
jgi:muconolactone delta-isomerase